MGRTIFVMKTHATTAFALAQRGPSRFGRAALLGRTKVW
jgi:hypothetical protein